MTNTIPNIPPLPITPTVDLSALRARARKLRLEIEEVQYDHPRSEALKTLLSHADGMEFNIAQAAQGAAPARRLVRAGFCLGRLFSTAGDQTVARNLKYRSIASNWQSQARELLDLIEVFCDTDPILAGEVTQ